MKMFANCIASNYARRFITILIVTLFTCTLCNDAYARQAVQVTSEKHFLWSVETAHNTIYLLGSLHILRKDSYPLPAAIEGIYDCCNKVVFETDLDAMNDPGFQAQMKKRGMYPAGQTLSKNISQETYGLLKKKLSLTGLQIAQVEQFRPWFVGINIAGLELQRLGFVSDLGIDRTFFQKAGEDNKEMIFLETNEYQINLLAGLSNRRQETLLKQMLKELEVIEAMASDLVYYWKQGDLDKFESLNKLGFDEYPDIYDRFFSRRNKQWIRKIEKLMKQNEDVLIVVGAGHLVGKDSVIDLLTKKGYRVRQR